MKKEHALQQQAIRLFSVVCSLGYLFNFNIWTLNFITNDAIDCR
jgi:hypothetical protein